MANCAQCFDEVEFLYLDVCPPCYKKQTGKEPPVKLTKEGPTFDSMEDMMKFMEAANKGLARKKKAEKKPKKAKGHPPVDESLPAVPDSTIFQTVHFYVREKDTVESVQKDAREERKIRNNNVLVFVHAHAYGEECVPKCKEQL